jgi:hypothetical protein
MAKVHATQQYFKYFNNRPTKKSAETTFEAVRTAAKNLLNDLKIDYDAHEWVTVRKMLEPLSKAWDYPMTQSGYEFYFRRWWLDQLVSELGVMIWNITWHTVRETSDDRTADRIANEASEKFLKAFF